MEKLTNEILKQVIQPRPLKSHKGTFGKVLIIAGSQNYTGAALMATKAAVYTGAGLVTLATDPHNFTSVHAVLPEAMVVDLRDQTAVLQLAQTMNVIAMGPGLRPTLANTALLQRIINAATASQSLIMDATALNLWSEQSLTMNTNAQKIVLTPHAVEWQRLSQLALSTQQPSANLRCLRQKAPKQTVLVLKGAPTAIYDNQTGQIFQNTAGTAAMATGGTGDTLTGMIAGFLAQFSVQTATILAAVYLHSYIAEQLAQKYYVVLPTQLSEAIPYWMHYFAEQN